MKVKNPEAEPRIFAKCVHPESGLRVTIWQKVETFEFTDHNGLTHDEVLKRWIETDGGQPAYRPEANESRKWIVQGELGPVELWETDF